MKKNIIRISMLFCTVIFLSLFWHPGCRADDSGTPVVIRKKIAAPAEETQKNAKRSIETTDLKSGMLQPKPDISLLNKDSAEKMVADPYTAGGDKSRPLYDPAGKIDPFEPLFKEKPEIKSGSPTYAETNRKPTMALEKIDLSQLSLTGIILAVSGNKALVQEASGRGHVISTGTSIGIHGGRVTEVQKDRVIVKEKMKDVMGRIFFQETELKLNKANG